MLIGDTGIKIMATLLIKYKINKKEHYGILNDDKINELKGSVFGNYEILDKTVLLSDVEVLPPSSPTKIIALGYNYKDLVGYNSSYKEPIIFLKPPSSLIPNKGTIKRPRGEEKVWVEVELAIIIKKKCKNISAEEAKNYILGFTIGNDVTTENIHGRDHHLARSKALDTFCSLGPNIAIDLDTKDLKMKTRINGQIFQDSSTKNRIINDTQSVSLISKFMTLYPGDIIMTGTPANAESSLIQSGDVVELEIENIGTLTNLVSY